MAGSKCYTLNMSNNEPAIFTAKEILDLQAEGCMFTFKQFMIGPMSVDENGVYLCDVLDALGVMGTFSGPADFTVRCNMSK